MPAAIKPLIPRAEIIRLRRRGMSVNKLAVKAGVQKSTMASWLRAWNVKIDPNAVVTADLNRRITITPAFKQALEKKYWQEGFSLIDIARHMGVNEHVVRHWFKKAGIPRRSREDAVRNAARRKRWNSGHKWNSQEAHAAAMIAVKNRRKLDEAA